MSFRNMLVAAVCASAAMAAPAMAAEPIVSTLIFTTTFDTYQTVGAASPFTDYLGPAPLTVTAVFSFEEDELNGGYGDVLTTVRINGGPDIVGWSYISAITSRDPVFRFGAVADLFAGNPGQEGLFINWDMQAPSGAFDPLRALPLTNEVLAAYPINARLQFGAWDGRLSPRVTATQKSGTTGTAEGEVVVLAVPEPSAWALMILGFGAAGAALRRRRLYPALAK